MSLLFTIKSHLLSLGVNRALGYFGLVILWDPKEIKECTPHPPPTTVSEFDAAHSLSIPAVTSKTPPKEEEKTQMKKE